MPGAVGVVAEDFIGRNHQRIDRTGLCRARRKARRQPEGLLLERHRDVGAAAAGVDELAQGRGKAIDRRKNGPVIEILRRLPRKGGMNDGRLAVGDGVAEDGVVVGHLGDNHFDFVTS